ncbi:MAG: FAD-binding oxidoreductase [Deltaproteobacteria bacterium]|jgi:FAD/FMN-containing dehydrogenase|nr:FAD-binding oxidoreductase [Deltaproteobacteria bacterium]
MVWNYKVLKSLEVNTPVIPKDDERIETYSEDTMYRGSPDAVLIARDEREITETLKFCNKNKVPITFCGTQTSMTGASVPDEGLLVSTELIEGVEDIYQNENGTFAVVKPGTVTALFQKEVANAGYFYPVAPTSRDQCRIGSNISTNATGEDSYKYGPVREYVQSIDIIMPDGSKRVLTREPGEHPTWVRNKAGYLVEWGNPIDLIIGSEGTLGFISRATIKLLPKARPFFSALIPFRSNWDALNFAIDTNLNDKDLNPRTLELIDSGALKLMKTSRTFPEIDEEIGSLLYIKQEYDDDEDFVRWIEVWLKKITHTCGKDLADQTMVAFTYNDQEIFRLWRHRIPEAANEIGRKYWKNAGGKIGSDWWAPMDKLAEMMRHFYLVADASGLPYMGYAHIGCGHPHTNFLSQNAVEKQKALEALASCCRKAVELGGGVAGEHGIGKIHTDLMPIQYSHDIINKMKAWKREYDPNWILGRGNIFEAPNT